MTNKFASRVDEFHIVLEQIIERIIFKDEMPRNILVGYFFVSEILTINGVPAGRFHFGHFLWSAWSLILSLL